MIARMWSRPEDTAARVASAGMASPNGSSRPISVGVVGAGFGGVGMGIRLRQEGIEDFEIFERGETVGGVWRANTYPGAACDVPSHLYSFSFAPGHNWSRRYAPQPEILSSTWRRSPTASACARTCGSAPK